MVSPEFGLEQRHPTDGLAHQLGLFHLDPTGGALVSGGARRFCRNQDADLTTALAGTGTIYMSILANFSGGLGAWNSAAFEVGSNIGAALQKARAGRSRTLNIERPTSK